MKAQGAFSRRCWKPGQEHELGGFLRFRELVGGGGRERERQTDTGTQALMDQRCFNDLSVNIYRLLYKEFLSTMIKIRKSKVQQPLPREQGINNGHRVRRQSISQEKGLRLSSFVVRRIFTEGDSCMSHPMTSVLGAACCSTCFCCQKLIREDLWETACRNPLVELSLTTPPYLFIIFVKRVWPFEFIQF